MVQIEGRIPCSHPASFLIHIYAHLKLTAI